MTWEDAEITSLLGIRVYTFGLYVAFGAALFALSTCLLCRKEKLKSGAGLMTTLLCMVSGAFFSRLAFCLMNQELGGLMPFFSWFRLSGGGWSMMGLVGGVLLGAFCAGKVLHVPAGKLLDIACLGLPLFIMSERLGEQLIPDFDISRTTKLDWVARSFLAVRDDYGAYLATWALASFCALILFVLLFVRRIRRQERAGNLCIVFLLLFGAAGTVLESLRYDRFLSITFVGLQEIIAMLYLCAGVIAALMRERRILRKGHRMVILSVLPFTACIGVMLEFALDRTQWNHLVIYLVMIATMLIPALLGLWLLRGDIRKGKALQ